MLEFPAADAENSLLILIVIYIVFVVAASVLVGMVTDRRGSRRLWTAVSALVQACSGIIILISPNFTTTAVAAGVMGAGFVALVGGFWLLFAAGSTTGLKNSGAAIRRLLRCVSGRAWAS
ncbi:hypothetical protein [Brevibacterium siliguriense]|uniref:hypothetical protein n=1 Tax=Brevibacterium siliguriense TaxID=1136497 RepID=UPI000A84DBF7|nr:hypothetical protein [Brevibacterium siliguriense]